MSQQTGSMAAATSIPDGAYVTAEGSENTLFRIQNGRRQPIEAADVTSLGITQKDIQSVDSLVLYSMPLETTGTGTRAVGREVRSYLDSFLGAGHYMYSWVWLQGTTLTVKTKTQTITWFGGYTGGVQIVLYDAAGNRINHDTIRYRYGIDGTAFGPGWREDSEVRQVPQDVANAAESIAIAHYWDPKVDIIGTAIQVARYIWELIQIIREKRESGELGVNAGGRPF